MNCKSSLALKTVLLLAFVSAAGDSLTADEPAAVKNTQPETIKLTTPAEALAAFTVPDGFSVSLFAAEPDVRQPIGMTTDGRGRLWVAENNTYAEQPANFDTTQRDRITILEDTDHDGRSDRRKVFYDQAQRLTSVEVGFGGVWALCPPQLLFIPDRDGDDLPDGKPQVILDGWDFDKVRHNIANGLKWGPDGWLYGRHGILANSLVGPPGATPSQRTALDCCIWRYHPTTKAFEVVCRGTTNPWGMDWNEDGELFFINTVIGHLWHAVPGAHYQRMYGEEDNPHLYELIGQTADHFHWDTAESWHDIRTLGVTPTTDQAGGGHAHCGLMIYQGENWPQRYRGSMFTINMHGRRLNNDKIERSGASYVGRHAPDLLKTSDPWFRGIELITGSDGGVFLADWSDIGECHEIDGVHRSSGRIFKIVHGAPTAPIVADVASLSDAELVKLQTSKNDWLARQSRRVLQERAAAGQPMDQTHEPLKTMVTTGADHVAQLRALWSLHVTGGASDAWLLAQLKHPNEHVRAWVVRLLADQKAPSAEAVRAFAELGGSEPSGLVQLYLASALQKIPTADRWSLAEALANRSEFATDPVLTRMVWYGIEPAIPDDPARANKLAESSPMPMVIRSIARRLTENLAVAQAPVNQLVASLNHSNRAERILAILTGMAEALRGQRKAPMPESWRTVEKSLASSADADVRQLSQELSVVFGDGRALQELTRIVANKSAEPTARRDAMRVLVEARAEGLSTLLCKLIDERDVGAEAVRSLAAFEDPNVPGVLIKAFRGLKEPARDAAIVTLSSRPAWARALLEAVDAGTIDRALVPTFQVRQMSAFADEEVRKKVAALWPDLRPISAVKKERIEKIARALGAAELAAADLPNGRMRFVQACATCHTLFSEGAKIAPDLTGAQRANLTYLLENIVDPSATVTPGYRMSTVVLTDGRVLNGLVGAETGPILTVQTPTERLSINRSDVEEIQKSELSLMPDGLLDALSEKELRDLIAYLMSPSQVPKPVGRPVGAASR